LAGDSLYFGAGYNLYRLDLSSRLIERIYATDRARVEQPIVADGTVFFGGLRGIDKYGWRGEDEGFFAVDLTSRKIQWKFSMASGYGTFGTYPVLAKDRILACSRWDVYSLDRKSGKETWRVDNWMGSTGDTVNIPYVFDDHAYFKVSEEHVAASQKTDENGGHWAEVDLDTGQRTIFHIADRPGTYGYSSGEDVGTLVDGVIYGNNRVDRFGALDLRAKRLLWELPTDTHIKPVVLNGTVYLVRNDEIQAVDGQTGKTIWAVPLAGISRPISDENYASSRFEELFARRMTSDGQVLIVQGSTAIAAFDPATGKQRWRTEIASTSTPVIPLIVGANVYVLSDIDCSIVALDMLNGKELWRVGIPDCASYYFVDD